jgi:hypothetical protein
MAPDHMNTLWPIDICYRDHPPHRYDMDMALIWPRPTWQMTRRRVTWHMTAWLLIHDLDRHGTHMYDTWHIWHMTHDTWAHDTWYMLHDHANYLDRMTHMTRPRTWKMTYDMANTYYDMTWHMTHDTTYDPRHMTRDTYDTYARWETWHMTHDTWHDRIYDLDGWHMAHDIWAW